MPWRHFFMNVQHASPPNAGALPILAWMRRVTVAEGAPAGSLADALEELPAGGCGEPAQSISEVECAALDWIKML